ncbi:MAG: DUF839 domain-containing protein [Alphaproteobacteria bacterium]|nr:DUF839 domain-containing protein [Alphaproteobacteria bacterium]
MRTLALALALAACGSHTPPETPAPEPPAPADPGPPLAVTGIEIPADGLTLRAPVWATRAMLGGTELDVSYHTLFRTGDGGFGEMFSETGADLGEVCSDQDFDSLIVAGGKPWLVSHFECVPGAIWVTPLDQAADGALSPGGEPRPVDWSAWGGVWFPCSGQVSPWGTHLGSEEYEPDARQWRPDGTLTRDLYGAWKDFSRYLTDPAAGSPYRYGWPLELAIDDQGTPVPAKRYAMGRFSHELSYVLPDRRTVYQSDDGTAVGLFMFVADEAGALDAGTLYAARFTTEGERARTEWVSLGHATQAEIAALVERKPLFSEIFEVAEPAADHTCAEGFTFVDHGYGRECLKLAAPSERVPDPALAASRLESRRYAAMLGATTELEKTEGITFDPDSGTVFLSVSTIRGRMLAEPDAPQDGLRFEENRCGAVWGGTSGAGVVDTSGAPIASEHVIGSMGTVTKGTPLAEIDALGNGCDTGGIANPDNLTFLPGHHLLMVAEDTKWGKGHVNAVLWAVDVRDGSKQRLLVAPPGGEVTGIHWIPDLLGHGYLTTVVQHPWSEMPKDQPVPDGITDEDRRAFTGYFGPFPSLAR